MIPTILVFLLLAPSGPGPQDRPDYSDVLAMYQRGEFERAVVALRSGDVRDIGKGLDAVIAAFRKGASIDRLEAAALLHTEAFFSARIAGEFGTNAAGDALVRVIERADANSAFARRWRLLMSAFLQGRQDLRAALAYVSTPMAEQDPEFAHAQGAIHERIWMAGHERGQQPPREELTSAVRALRRSLAQRPDAEAQVRLGRVLTLLENYVEAEAVLASVKTTEPGYQYLARLFEGDLAERRGDKARAVAAYEAAIAAFRDGQSAPMALAHLRHAAGRRAEALGLVRQTVVPRAGVAETADPWAWYSRGLAWRADGYLDELRQMVVRPAE